MLPRAVSNLSLRKTAMTLSVSVLPAFVPFAGNLDDILCVHEARTVGNDNTVHYKGRTLQIPEDSHRHHYVKAKVRVHEYAGAHLAVIHGPRRLAVYEADGTFKEEGEKRAA